MRRSKVDTMKNAIIILLVISAAGLIFSALASESRAFWIFSENGMSMIRWLGAGSMIITIIIQVFLIKRR